ncbi:MAG: F0F1 ATP synthase subunit epsilon [Ignavibacterium sp.]
MKEFDLEIYTPVKKYFTGKIKSITIPGTLGEFQILFNHAPLISTFEIGKIKIVNVNDEESIYATSGGTVEVLNNKVKILADSIEKPENIDIERARQSLERAKARLSEKNNPNIDFARAEASLKRAINRLKITNSLN